MNDDFLFSKEEEVEEAYQEMINFFEANEISVAAGVSASFRLILNFLERISSKQEDMTSFVLSFRNCLGINGELKVWKKDEKPS